MKINIKDFRNEELNHFIKSLTEQLTNDIINQNIYNTMMAEYREEKETIEATINRYKLIEENGKLDLEAQAKLLFEKLENIKDEEILSQIFLRQIISKIVITSIPVEHTTKKKKEITIYYKRCNEYVNEFIKDYIN